MDNNLLTKAYRAKPSDVGLAKSNNFGRNKLSLMKRDGTLTVEGLTRTLITDPPTASVTILNNQSVSHDYHILPITLNE